MKGTRIQSIQSWFTGWSNQTICFYVLRCSLFGLVIRIWRTVRLTYLSQNHFNGVIHLYICSNYICDNAGREVPSSLSMLIWKILTKSTLRHHVHSGSSSSKLWVTMKSPRSIYQPQQFWFSDIKQIRFDDWFDGSLFHQGLRKLHYPVRASIWWKIKGLSLDSCFCNSTSPFRCFFVFFFFPNLSWFLNSLCLLFCTWTINSAIYRNQTNDWFLQKGKKQSRNGFGISRNFEEEQKKIFNKHQTMLDSSFGKIS